MQQPFGFADGVCAIAAQQPCEATAAIRFVAQQAGRPAAITGTIAPAATKKATILLRFIMRTRQVKIPATTRPGNRHYWRQ